MESNVKLSIKIWKPNALIYDYDTPSFNAYFIIEGQVDIFTPRGLKLNSIGPSEVFGEASLLLDKKGKPWFLEANANPSLSID